MLFKVTVSILEADKQNEELRIYGPKGKLFNNC